jgi:uncharacterized membrane protein SpoIIM required for sporulation
VTMPVAVLIPTVLVALLSGFVLGVALTFLLRISLHNETRNWSEIGWHRYFYVRILRDGERPDDL